MPTASWVNVPRGRVFTEQCSLVIEMALQVINIHQALRQVDQPFVMVELAAVGELALHGYVCLGAITWHKHTDYDEAFWVVDGAMALESEWGNVMLHAGELAVVPKGIAHRSGSQLRTVVVLFRTRGLPDRKNGHRRIFGVPGANQLTKNNLNEMAARVDPFYLEPFASVDDYTLQFATGDGVSPTFVNSLSASIWLNWRGRVSIETDDETVELTPGSLTVVPCDVPHRWIGLGPSLVLWAGLTESSVVE